MHFGAIRLKWRPSNDIGTKSFQPYYGHPWLAGKRLVNAHNFVLNVQKMTLSPRIF